VPSAAATRSVSRAPAFPSDQSALRIAESCAAQTFAEADPNQRPAGHSRSANAGREVGSMKKFASISMIQFLKH
jgi:hypothetical protein